MSRGTYAKRGRSSKKLGRKTNQTSGASKLTARRKLLHKKNKTPVFPPAVYAFFTRRLVDIFGLTLCVLGCGILGALYSYHPDDPSLNTATPPSDIQNWLGAPGAYTADLLLQTIGIAGWMIGFILAVWGYRITRRHPLYNIGFKIPAVFAAVFLSAIAAARVPAFTGWDLGPYLGGSAGAMLFNKVTALVHPFLTVEMSHGLITGLTGFLGLAAFCYALGFDREEWAQGFARVRIILSFGLSFIQSIFNGLQNLLHSRLFVRDLENSLTATRRTPPPVAPKRKKSAKVAPKPQPLKPGKRAKKEKQTSLNLGPTGEWAFPPLDLLFEAENTGKNVVDESALQRNAELLQSVLQDFGVEGDIVAVHPGPVVTLYELEPAPGIKTSRVISLADDIARSMSAISVRCAVIPGRNVIGIELPNTKREFVYLRELLASQDSETSQADLPLLLGKDIGGQPVIADLSKMPHLLIAGTTGAGKSVTINTMILSLLYRLPPEKCRIIMIDPKMLELSVYDDIPHLLTPVVTDPAKAIQALKWIVAEMEDRYKAMSKLGVRNIDGYNIRLAQARKKGEVIMRKVQTGFDPDTGKPCFEDQALDLNELPHIVVVVDEFADLMMVAGKEVENCIQRLAQMARAAGIHMIMATQRPSVDVITGTIKANFPSRISFQVTSKIDSRTILGEGGAEHLLGQGDMLYMSGGGRITRVHGPFVSDEEVEEVTQFLRDQGEPDYIDDVTEGGEDGSVFSNSAFGDNDIDALYQRAVEIVIQEGKASTSFVQRHLQIGYNRAARIIEQMEKDGIISGANHVGKREILL